VVHFLRKVVWTVPGFSVERHRDRLRDLHGHIEREGRFVAHSQRYLIEARRAAWSPVPRAIPSATAGPARRPRRGRRRRSP
jgi:hypothetical protein